MGGPRHLKEEAKEAVRLRQIVDRIEPIIGPVVPELSEDPVQELIETILSQNTTDRNAHRAMDRLCERYRSWAEVRDADSEELIETIRVAGLAQAKAKTIQTALRSLPEDENGQPTLDPLQAMDDEEAIRWLTQIPGVGVKTAACLLLFAYGRNVCPVDTHIHRVLNRIGIVHTRSPDQTHALVNRWIPPGEAYRYHVLLIRFGRRICSARSPRCGGCPVFDLCAYPEKNLK